MMSMILLASVAALPLLLAPAAQTVSVEATVATSREAGGNGVISLRFWPTSDEYRVNRSPAPRLELDQSQRILTVKGPAVLPGTSRKDIAENDQYLEPGAPVTFAAAVAQKAAKGSHEVGGRVVFFYCSVREATCRRGSADLNLIFQLP
jgi:hypothetical protein